MAPIPAIDLTKEKPDIDTLSSDTIPQLSTQLNDTHIINATGASGRRLFQTSLLSKAKITKRKAICDTEASVNLHKDCYSARKTSNTVTYPPSSPSYKRPRASGSTTIQSTSPTRAGITVDISDDDNDDGDGDGDDDDSTVVGDDFAASHRRCLDLSIVLHDPEIQIVQTVNRRQSNTSSTSRPIDRVKTDKYTCAPGKFIELSDQSFMKISSMYRDDRGVAWIVGQWFTRHDYLDGHRWPRRHNELVLQSIMVKGCPAELTKRRLSEVLRNRQLILTNDLFPGSSIHYHVDACGSRGTNIAIGPLFCRWRQTQILDESRKLVEQSIECISPEEADPKFKVDPTKIRKRWRQGQTDLGGSQTTFTRSPGVGNEMQETQQYTFGDAFCGGGGASCGANEAGLHVKFGVDFNENAMKTYKLNFSEKGTDCHSQDIFNFIQTADLYTRRIDVLHISPPCQPFSPAHTIESQTRDEMNQAAMFAVGALIKTVKPRVVTLEETFGLLNRHPEWFDALIKEFVDIGYSIRWANARLEEYGLPQKRRRLLIIASGPGEILPPFPSATNSETDDHLPRLRTIHDAISAIPTSFPNHDLIAARYQSGDERIPYSQHTQAKTITCSGGQGNHHPSGKRAYTVRELAALQRFPLTYKFADVGITDLRRQIGNAVPPYVFKKVLREVIKSLKETDEKEK